MGSAPVCFNLKSQYHPHLHRMRTAARDLEERADSDVVVIMRRMTELESHGSKPRAGAKTKSFEEEWHPRRKEIYRPFFLSNDTFFRLRANGVPPLTAYFLCDPYNRSGVQRRLQDLVAQEKERDDALRIISNI